MVGFACWLKIHYVKPHVYIASETKLDKTVYSSEFMPQDYRNVFRNDRSRRGVLIAHRDDVIATPVKLDGIKDDCELTVSKIKMSSNKPPLYVMAYYRSQIDNSANTSLDSLESAIKQVVELVGNSKSTIILAGDFNCPGIDWDNLVPGNRVVGVSEKLIQITTEHGLSQQQRDPTKLDALLDLVFANNESLIHSTSTIPGISTANEHESIVVDLDLKAEVNKSIPHTVYQ